MIYFSLLKQGVYFYITISVSSLLRVLLRLFTPWKTLSNVFDSMRSQPKGTRRFKVELKITAMSWAVYKPQDHGKFMLEGTSGALYPVILLISRLNFSFFFFPFYAYYLSSSHQALSCEKPGFVSLTDLWALGATFRYIPSCLFPRMNQSCSLSLSSHPQGTSASTLSILVALGGWTLFCSLMPSFGCFPKMIALGFWSCCPSCNAKPLYVVCWSRTATAKVITEGFQGFQRQMTWHCIEPLELFSETLLFIKQTNPFHSNFSFVFFYFFQQKKFWSAE